MPRDSGTAVPDVAAGLARPERAEEHADHSEQVVKAAMTRPVPGAPTVAR
ncbi:hypothetical protein SAMN06272739_2489 [Blastococcus haudaquaticus]|uniref:Uncharacterized protein n=1 Tax=Blastococcus haudaquaticus TaxID=1938745 RepID=A0A286GYU5_9ACTN|nr:hypothetical protein SAMN06272739_2489 [Blastococcus haudaquaticus]